MLPLRDENPTRRPTVVTWVLVAACIAVYVFVQQEPQRETEQDLLFNLEHAAIPCELTSGEPLSVEEADATFGRGSLTSAGEDCGIGSPDAEQVFPDKNVWLAALSSMFFHGGLLHLGGNMLYLWIFGNNVEDHLGHARYLFFYVAGGVAATAAHVLVQPDSTIPVVGASGAIAAIMGAYLVWFPNAPVRTLIFLGWFIFMRDIAAKWLLGFWLLLQFFTSPNSGVAWMAHVGGFVFGVAVGLVVRGSRAARHALWTGDHRDEMDRQWDTTGGAGRNPYERRHFGNRRS